MSFVNSYVAVLDKEGLNHSDIRSNGEIDMVEFGMKTDYATVRVKAFFEGELVGIRCFDLVQVPEDKFADVLFACNKLNSQFKFMTFYVDEDNQVCISSDALLDEATAGTEAFTLAIQSIKIAEKAYPVLMKALWN